MGRQRLRRRALHLHADFVQTDLSRRHKSLASMCDRLALDASERDDRHGALLDADMTADALILLEHLLKHGESAAPRSWTSA